MTLSGVGSGEEAELCRGRDRRIRRSFGVPGKSSNDDRRFSVSRSLSASSSDSNPVLSAMMRISTVVEVVFRHDAHGGQAPPNGPDLARATDFRCPFAVESRLQSQEKGRRTSVESLLACARSPDP